MKTQAEKAAYYREYYQRNREKQRLYYQNHRDRDRAQRRNTDLKWRYGLTTELVDQLLRKQGNACAICRHAFDGKGKQGTPHIDHEHGGDVRGILCNNCNRSLGGFKDRADLLWAAIDYLVFPPADDLLTEQPPLPLEMPA